MGRGDALGVSSRVPFVFDASSVGSGGGWWRDGGGGWRQWKRLVMWLMAAVDGKPNAVRKGICTINFINLL